MLDQVEIVARPYFIYSSQGRAAIVHELGQDRMVVKA
jgi:hypothetical protein